MMYHHGGREVRPFPLRWDLREFQKYAILVEKFKERHAFAATLSQ